MQFVTDTEAYIEEATVVLKGKGLTVRWGSDFNVFHRLIQRNGERPAPGVGFNPSACNEDKLEGVWLVAYRGAGELVHTQACRKVNIAPNLNQHLKTGANAYDTESFKFDLSHLEISLSPEAATLSGDAVYHGEAWLKGGPEGIRGGSALCLFSRMMIAKILSLWDVGHIYGFIPPMTGLRGLAQRYGYTRCEQGAVTLLDRQTFPNDLWLVWMTAAEAHAQLRLKPVYFEDALAPTGDAKIGKVA